MKFTRCLFEHLLALFGLIFQFGDGLLLLLDLLGQFLAGLFQKLYVFMLMLVHLLSFGLLNFGSLEFVLNGCLLLLGESKILFELGDQLLTATMFLSKVLKFLLGSGELVLGVGELLRLLLELTHYAHLCFLQVLLLEFFFGFLLPHN